MTSPALSIDRSIIRDAQMRSTGATVHGVANLIQAYEFAVEDGDRKIATWAKDALYVFGATGVLPTAASALRAAA